jgi:tetratricopeptide (TPR) repeat protein
MKNLSVHKIIILTWLLTCFARLSAQQSYRQQTYQYYLADKISAWEQVIERMRNNQASLTRAEQIDLVGYYYGYIGWTIGEGKDKQAKKDLELAEEILNKLLDKYPEMPDLYAFKGAFTGYKITMNSIRAVVLGPESMKHINHAIDIGPDRPQPWIEKGNALFYMPKMFGGSKEKAIEAYIKAIKIMEQDPGMIKDNWMYLNVLLILGQGYETIGQPKKAGAIYEKTLQHEPGFKTLKNEVYPAYLKKWESQK